MDRLRKTFNRVMDELTARLDDWVLRSELQRHKPEEMGTGTPRNAQEVWCMSCVEPWPCPTWMLRTDQRHRKIHPEEAGHE